MHSRTQKIQISKYKVVVAFLAAHLTVDLSATLPAPDGGEPMMVIDMHTHVFNAHDLPLAGILNSRGAPLGISDSLARLINAWTASDDSAGPLPNVAVMAPSSRALREEALRELQSALPAAPGNSLFAPLSSQEQAELLEFVGESGQSEINMMPPPPGAPADAPPQPQELEVVARALQKLDFPPGENPPRTEGPGVAAPFGGIGGYLQFLGVMLKGNSYIARLLESQEYPKVDLFIHHMMDMQRSYASKPVISFEEQMIRMARLNARFPGKFLHFVAFDPFRREDSLAVVQRGLQSGAIGVKFYPGSGYRASSNAIPEEPSLFKPGSRSRWNSRYKDLTDLQLDQLTDDLFRYAEQASVPIFTHCTPFGFQADEKYGLNADPLYWKAVLEKYPRLRLCFGHAGGDSYWFGNASGTNGASYGTQVLELSLQFVNVYCEVGYLEDILEKSSRDKFTSTLKKVIERQSADGQWRFGDKIMYGTDWHMIHKETKRREYLDSFAEVFTDPALTQWARRFFAGNAARYLRLETLTNNPSFNEAQRVRIKQIVDTVKKAP